jgi:hypothetical protein
MLASSVYVEFALPAGDCLDAQPTSLELLQEYEEQRCLRLLTERRRHPFMQDRPRND